MTIKKSFILILINVLFSQILFSQNWIESYNKFTQEFQEQKYAEAIISGNQTLKEIGVKDSNYVSVLRYLAYSYYSVQDYNKAVETYKETQSLCKSLYGVNNYTYILVTFNLAVNYTYIGKYSMAYPLMDEVINYIIKDQTKNSLDYINTANQQANIYNIAGSYDKAQQIYEEVYEVVKNNYAETDSMYMATVNIIAPFYFSHGMYDKAEPFYTHSVEMMEKAYGKSSANYIITLNSLGEFYIKSGMYSKSEKVYSEFVELCLKFYGKNSADYATSLNNLAVTYEKQGKNTQAEDLYLQCLKVKEKVFRKESNFYALSLSNLAVLYDNMGKYKEEEELLVEALDIYKKIYGEKTENYAIALSTLASLYSNNGKYKEAIELAKKALEIQFTLYGEKYDAYINSLNNLSLLFDQAGNIDSAEKYINKAQELRRITQGESHADYAITIYNLANIKITKGDYLNAEKLLKKALEIQKIAIGEYSSSFANTLNSLAGLYSTIGNFQLAEETYSKCKIIFEKIYGDMHPEYATYLCNLGLFYFESGQYDKSEETLKKSLEIQYNSFGKEHPNNMNILANLANTFIKKGHNKQAEEYILKAVSISKEKLGVEHPNYASSILGLGVFYYETGNYDKAEKYYKEALEKYKNIYGENSSNYSTALNNIGSLYLAKAISNENQKEANEFTVIAADYFFNSLKTDSIVNGIDNPDYAMHINNLAELYRNTGQFEKAEPLYLKSIEIEKKIYGENYSDLAVTYHNLALLYNGSQKLDKAEYYCLKSLKLKQLTFGENNPVCAETMSSLAYIYECSNNFIEAEKYYSKALQLNFELIKNNFSYLSEEEKSNYLKTLSLYKDMFMSYAVKSKKENPRISNLVYNNELVNKGILLKSTSKIRKSILNSNDNVLIEKYNNWIGIKQQLAKLYSLPNSNKIDTRYSLEEHANNLEKDLVLQSNDFLKGKELFNLNWINIKNNLKTNEASIEFTHYKKLENNNTYSDNYCALIILPGNKYPELISLFESKELENVIGTFGGNNLDYISKIYGSSKTEYKKLYEIIWKPLDSILTGINTIYFSPSGLLHKISFSSILTNENKFLSDKYTLISLASTNLITERNYNNILSKNLNLCVFGGAQYSSVNGEQEIWKYLEGTKQEANKINKIFTNNKLNTTEYCGLIASEENFKSLSGNNAPTILHIATHGFFYPDPKEIKEKKDQISEIGDVAFRGGGLGIENFVKNTNPLMRSGLALARANDIWSKPSITGEDGVLTAYEVSNMDLQNTKLLVMSACETGLGDIKGSEGVYGLQRAFKIAGVKFIIMSLWQVPDKETEEFMTTFYTKLLKLKDIRQSFYETQKQMRNKYDPYYWGAFVLIE